MEMDLEYQYLIGRLQEALAADPRVNSLDIKIVLSGGKLHLTGQVPTEQRRQAVNEVILEVVPGISIRNELTLLELAQATSPEEIRA
jgi:osmotically-inducible protein OsmY